MKVSVLPSAGNGGATGSMSSMVSRDDNAAFSSEDSSSPDDGDLELGLGLSLGGGCFKGQRYGRILTAMDLHSVQVSGSPPSSSFSTSTTSSCSSTLSRVNVTAGTKRSADSVAASNASPSQLVGWPPIRAYRMNSMVTQAKTLGTEEFNLVIEKNKIKSTVLDSSKNGSSMNNSNAKGRASFFIKVNMDGTPIGRKVDLCAHGCYETLAQTLEEMFLRPPTTLNTLRSSALEHKTTVDTTRRSKLLNGSSEFVLIYEDKEGDWMLVGDVPWRMFLSSVKRLRIMRKSEAAGVGPRFQ